jgi:excinuclease ABC subunit B
MAKSPARKYAGFEEAPQPDLTGSPLSGSVSDWAEQIAREAEADSFETRREVASKAGKHRRKAAAQADDLSGGTPNRATRGKADRPYEQVRGPRGAKARSADSASAYRTARGTSMGGAASAKERAAAGLNPVPGLDIALEDAETLTSSGVTATVAALSKLIEGGDPNLRREAWVPHRPARPEKSEGGVALKMASEFQPAGDQPTAIKDLVEGVANHDRTQVLLGVTGSG